jgi:hypothetical protein
MMLVSDARRRLGSLPAGGSSRLYIAASVEDAIAALADRKGEGAALAGGTWIMRAPIKVARDVSRALNPRARYMAKYRASSFKVWATRRMKRLPSVQIDASAKRVWDAARIRRRSGRDQSKPGRAVHWPAGAKSPGGVSILKGAAAAGCALANATGRRVKQTTHDCGRFGVAARPCQK